MANYPSNTCTHKRECKFCNIVSAEDRPGVCIEMECEHFTPCKNCGHNYVLGPNFKCGNCNSRNQKLVKSESGETATTDAKHNSPVFIASDEPSNSPDVSIGNNEQTERELSITKPGVPPPEFDAGEKDYYLSQWNEYKGFYVDPTAWPTVHQLILLEIELLWLGNELVKKRGESKADLERQRKLIIDSMESLRKQLPAKEAQAMSDEEAALAFIYETYLEEKGKKEFKVGDTVIRRVFSPAAVALAPVLPIPVNLSDLLTRLGWRTVDQMEVLDSMLELPVSEDPKKFANYYGFVELDENYALPYNEKTVMELNEEGPETMVVDD